MNDDNFGGLANTTIANFHEEGEMLMEDFRTTAAVPEPYTQINNKLQSLTLDEAQQYKDEHEDYNLANLPEHFANVFEEKDLKIVAQLYAEVEMLHERTNINETMTRTIVNKFNDLSSRLRKLEAQRSGVSKGEQDSSRSEKTAGLLKEFDDAITVLCNELLLMQSTVEAHKMQNSREKENYEKKFLDLQSKIVEKKHRMQTNGKFTWRVSDYERIFRLHSTTQDVERMSITSAHFQTPSGHEFRLRAFLHGTGKGKGKYLSMFIQTYKSELDDILEYPFNAVIVFKVYDQSSKGDKKHHKLMFRTNNSVCFQRPARNVDYTPENGLAQLLSHEHILKNKDETGDGPVYLKNDTIFLGVEILPS